MGDATIDQKLKALTDPVFRPRAVHEYGIVARYLRDFSPGHRGLDRLRILDFGCGQGIAAASFALRHPTSVVFGVDVVSINPARLDARLRKFLSVSIPENLALHSVAPGAIPNEVNDLDVVYSWSTFEHVPFRVLEETFSLVRSRLKSDRPFFMQVNPLYFSSRGSHLYNVLDEPWVHLTHQIDELKTLVDDSELAEGSKRRHWDQFVTLNRATANDLLDAAEAAGFRLEHSEIINSNGVTPPLRLSRIYAHDVLMAEELRAVFRA